MNVGRVPGSTESTRRGMASHGELKLRPGLTSCFHLRDPCIAPPMPLCAVVLWQIYDIKQFLGNFELEEEAWPSFQMI